MIMARRKSNSAKAARGAGNSHGGGLPSFDENALSALTAKIEKEFDAGKSHQPREPNRIQMVPSGMSDQRTVKAQSNSNPTELVRGTKRDVRGNAKLPSKEVGSSGDRSAKKKNRKGNDDGALLLKEILALGGTEEDLDLVADAQSDEEPIDLNASLPDKAFRRDLANFVAGLGIDGDIDEINSGGSGDENIDDGWENASDSNTSTSSDDEKDVEPVPAAPLHNPPPDDPKRLVSNISAGLIGLTNSQ
jgi:ribosome biogenesis protein MAK21